MSASTLVNSEKYISFVSSEYNHIRVSVSVLQRVSFHSANWKTELATEKCFKYMRITTSHLENYQTCSLFFLLFFFWQLYVELYLTKVQIWKMFHLKRNNSKSLEMQHSCNIAKITYIYRQVYTGLLSIYSEGRWQKKPAAHKCLLGWVSIQSTATLPSTGGHGSLDSIHKVLGTAQPGPENSIESAEMTESPEMCVKTPGMVMGQQEEGVGLDFHRKFNGFEILQLVCICFYVIFLVSVNLFN